jgi:hypothetical protein
MPKRKILVLIGAALTGLILASVVSVEVAGHNKKPEVQTSNEPLIGVKHPNQGQKHLQSLDEDHVAYNSNLPSSGPHYYLPADWGIDTKTIADELLVHNEEHGGIIIAYKPDLPQEQITQLRNIAQNLQAAGHGKGYKVLMFPRAKNTHPIQLGSWLYTLDLEQIDSQTIQKFYTQHLNNAPEPEAM